MNPRYADPVITNLFSHEETIRRWLKIEQVVAAHCFPITSIALRANTIIGDLADDRFSKDIQTLIRVVVSQEQVQRHDVNAFVWALASYVRHHDKDASAAVHYGLTSSDVVDTGVAMAVQAARTHIETLENEMRLAFGATVGRSDNPRVKGYTHGRLACGVGFIRRLLVPLELMSPIPLPPGKLSGPVGDNSVISGQDEELCLSVLLAGGNETPCLASTQCTHRLHLADLYYTLAANAAILEQIATNLRLMVFKGELDMTMSEGQAGSSSMPHKNNPIGFEKVCGLSRVLRANVSLALENAHIWLERDISHSCTERLRLEEALSTYAHMLRTMTVEIMKCTVTDAALADNDGPSQSYKMLAEKQASGMGRIEAWDAVKAMFP